jgi:hypothetical protein
MNEQLLKSALKIIKPLLPADSINALISDLIKSAIDYKNKIVLDTEAGEVEVIGVIYEVGGQVYTAIAVITATNQITRFEQVKPLSEIINQFLKKY